MDSDSGDLGLFDTVSISVYSLGTNDDSTYEYEAGGAGADQELDQEL